MVNQNENLLNVGGVLHLADVGRGLTIHNVNYCVRNVDVQIHTAVCIYG